MMMPFFFAANPIFDAYRTSDWFGKFIFLILLVLSIVTWVIFLQKWLFQKNSTRSIPSFFAALEKGRHAPLTLQFSSKHPFSHLYKVMLDQAKELLNKNHYFATNKEESVSLSRSDIDLLKAHVSTEISAQAKGLEKNLFVLSTIVSLAPFLGLLGTVWGILLTFNELQAGGLANTSQQVLSGLSMALGTTVCGLVVAIFALIGYNTLKNSMRHLVSDLEDFSQLLLASVEMQYRKVDAP